MSSTGSKVLALLCPPSHLWYECRVGFQFYKEYSEKPIVQSYTNMQGNCHKYMGGTYTRIVNGLSLHTPFWMKHQWRTTNDLNRYELKPSAPYSMPTAAGPRTAMPYTQNAGNTVNTESILGYSISIWYALNYWNLSYILVFFLQLIIMILTVKYCILPFTLWQSFLPCHQLHCIWKPDCSSIQIHLQIVLGQQDRHQKYDKFYVFINVKCIHILWTHSVLTCMSRSSVLYCHLITAS
jgi:hypothetical protein